MSPSCVPVSRGRNHSERARFFVEVPSNLNTIPVACEVHDGIRAVRLHDVIQYSAKYYQQRD